MLTEFVVIMQPFAEATDETQGNNIVKSSKVIPSVRGLQRHLDRVIDEIRYHTPMVEQLHRSLVTRLVPYTKHKVLIKIMLL